jgi:TRAP-type C4-dicarboxylate transport system substrate-binding protein
MVMSFAAVCAVKTEAAPAEEDRSGWISLNLSYATMLPESHPSTEQLTRFKEKADERMGGLVTFTMYPSSSLLTDTETYNGVRDGVADMGFLTTSTKVGVLDLALVCDQPGFWYESGSASAMAMYDYYMWLWQNSDEWRDVVPLTVLGLAPQAFGLNKEIKSLNDLKGLNLYCAASYIPALEAWGMYASILDYADLYESLRNNLIDGLLHTVGAIANTRGEEVVDYCYVTPLAGQANALIINRGVFESMPESQRKLFLELWKEVQIEYVNLYLENFHMGNDVSSQKFCREVKVIDKLPEDVEKQMYELVKNMPDKYAAGLDARGLPGTEALKYYREVLDKYNAQFPGSMDGYYEWRK